MGQDKNCWSIKNEAGSDTAVLYFYGEIESDTDERLGQYNAPEFAYVLSSLNGKNITLRINSPGGNVFEAQAIYNLLKAYKGKIIAHIDGICASAATLVACAAEKIVMPANSLFMIHNPACSLMDGCEAEDLRETADVLDSVKDCILNVYLAKTKGKLSEEEIRKMMDEETWMTSEEAIANGFVDEVDDFGVNASMKSGMVVVNGISMPTIRNRQEELVSLMRKKEKKVNNKDDGFMEKLKAALKEMGIGESKKEEPPVPTDEERISALDALKGKNVYADALVERAKADGKTAEDIAGYIEALAAVKVPEPKDPPKGAPKDEANETKAIKALGSIIDDQTTSGGEGVAPAAASTKEAEKAKAKASEVDAIVDFVNTMIRK